MTRTSFAFALTLLAVIGTQAQPVLTVENSLPNVGEVFIEYAGAALSPGGAGPDQVWDLSAFQPADTSVFSFASSTVDSLGECPLICPYGIYGGGYAIAQDPTRIFMGPAIHYPIGTLPLTTECSRMMSFPMEYEDQIEHQYAFRLMFGDCWDGFFFREETSVADGYGMLSLPFGTYGPVLRVHTMTGSIIPDSLTLHAYRFYLAGTHLPLATIAQGFPHPVDTTWVMRMLDPTSIVGVSEASTEPTGLTFRPQPVQDILFIQGVSDTRPATRVDIFDVSGRQVLANAKVDIRDGLDVGALSPGLYSLRLAFTGQPVRSGRFIKSDH